MAATSTKFEESTAGDVIGPDVVVDSHLAVFDGTDGKLLKDGGAVPPGNVVGPASVTANKVVLFDSTTGKLIKADSAGITGTITTSSLVGKTITITNGLITGFA